MPPVTTQEINSTKRLAAYSQEQPNNEPSRKGAKQL